jgi:hypothetical protein
MNLCIVKSLSGEMVKNIVWKRIRAGTYTVRDKNNMKKTESNSCALHL